MRLADLLFALIFPLIVVIAIVIDFVQNPREILVLANPIGLGIAVVAFFIMSFFVPLLIRFCVNWGPVTSKEWHHVFS